MKNKGYTLIEVIVSLFVLTILFNLSLSISKFNNRISNDIRNDSYIYQIQSLLSYGKAICKEKNKYGKLTVNTQSNEVRFIEGADKIEKIIKLPDGLKAIKNITLMINPDGKIETGNTIMLIDKQGERHDLTIRVGVDMIVIK